MLPSISKVWSEVSEESNSSKFKRDGPSKRRHYIHHDDPSRQSIRRSDANRGSLRDSSRALNPVESSKENSLWGAALKNISKVFKKEDEITSMKHYMDDMIGKPSAVRAVERGSRRSEGRYEGRYRGRESRDTELSNANETLSSTGSRRRRRTDSISSKIDELTNSLSRRERKRRQQEPIDPVGDGIDSSFSTRNTSHRRLYELPDVPRSTRDPGNTVNKYQSHNSDRRYVDPSWRSIARNSVGDTPSSSKIHMTKITARELPSSPVLSFKESTPKVTKQPEISIADSTADKSAMDSSRIDLLYAKVQELENTVQGLRDELKTSKAQQPEINSPASSFEDTISPVKPNLETKEQIFDYNISRPLSPVKLDLEKFKIIK